MKKGPNSQVILRRFINSLPAQIQVHIASFYDPKRHNNVQAKMVVRSLIRHFFSYLRPIDETLSLKALINLFRYECEFNLEQCSVIQKILHDAMKDQQDYCPIKRDDLLLALSGNVCHITTLHLSRSAQQTLYIFGFLNGNYLLLIKLNKLARKQALIMAARLGIIPAGEELLQARANLDVEFALSLFEEVCHHRTYHFIKILISAVTSRAKLIDKINEYFANLVECSQFETVISMAQQCDENILLEHSIKYALKRAVEQKVISAIEFFITKLEANEGSRIVFERATVNNDSNLLKWFIDNDKYQASLNRRMVTKAIEMAIRHKCNDALLFILQNLCGSDLIGDESIKDIICYVCDSEIVYGESYLSFYDYLNNAIIPNTTLNSSILHQTMQCAVMNGERATVGYFFSYCGKKITLESIQEALKRAEAGGRSGIINFDLVKLLNDQIDERTCSEFELFQKQFKAVSLTRHFDSKSVKVRGVQNNNQPSEGISRDCPDSPERKVSFEKT